MKIILFSIAMAAFMLLADWAGQHGYGKWVAALCLICGIGVVVIEYVTRPGERRNK
ncbi:MAG: hypothetical protein ACR2IJ_05930 [Fluviibacter sp.]